VPEGKADEYMLTIGLNIAALIAFLTSLLTITVS
jgi:hypothetical protein